jgi:hypothetical protein
LPGSSSSSRAATRVARLARGKVQSARWGAQATAVPKHARPCHVRSTRPSGDQRRNTRWRGGAQHPLQKMSRLDARFTHRFLARRRRAQGHEWPRSTTRSRGGSPAARWPALRHDHMAVCLGTAGASRKRPRWGRDKGGCGVLTLGRRCSRG